jgi:transposase
MPTPRIQTPNRNQLRFIPTCIDDTLPAQHPARDIWEYVQKVDLKVFYDAIKAVEGGPGRPPIDPRLLLALWIFATTEAVGSARELAELCTRDLAYMWLCGDVSVNYHTLADFRSKNEKKFKSLLAAHVATLMAAGVVQLQQVSQDGVRVRANAGSSSFRSRKRLKEIQAAAREQVDTLAKELHDDPGASARRKAAAQKRVKAEREARLKEAIARTEEIDKTQVENASHKSRAAKEKRKKSAEKDETRASSTDPEATRMKMGDGGYRPAFNVQTAMDPDSLFIVGVEVTQEGNDGGMLPRMADLLERTHGQRPSQMIADGGFVTLDAITKLEKHGIEVFAPVPRPQTEGADRFARRPKDTDESAAWRARMATEAAQATYKKRSRVEFPFARFRNWGLHQFAVKTIKRVSSSFLIFVLTHNYTNDMRLARLGVA